MLIITKYDNVFIYCLRFSWYLEYVKSRNLFNSVKNNGSVLFCIFMFSENLQSIIKSYIC